MIRITQRDRTAIRRLSERVTRAKTLALSKTGDHFFEVISNAVDQHTKTGALIQSLINNFDGRTYEITHQLQRAPHALYVHFGSRPHKIAPKNRKALRFARGGVFAFAKSVQHPGYKGDPYFVTSAPRAQVKDVFANFLKITNSLSQVR